MSTKTKGLFYTSNTLYINNKNKNVINEWSVFNLIYCQFVSLYWLPFPFAVAIFPVSTASFVFQLYAFQPSF